MFSALTQGSLVYILDKSAELKFKIGEVIGVSQPKFGVLGTNQPVVDIKVSIEGGTFEYNSIPSNLSMVTYNNGKLIISETKQGLQQEVESILQNSKQILNSIDTYKQNIVACEAIMKELNPQFAKDKERDDRLTNLEDKFIDVNDKLDKVLKALTNKTEAL